MRIAVTGGSGAIGHYVCDEFVRAGHTVVSLDRTPPASGIGFVQVDLRDLEQACAALLGFDQVVHLAAIPDPYNDPPLKESDYYRNHPYASVFDLRKAERLLGWQPRDVWENFEQWEF
jgi:nucleoside-diphosphate-sugar epimerase